MSNVTIEIGGEIVPVEFVWVHLQGGGVSASQDFSLTVPQEFVENVFDPTGDCPPDTPIEAHVRRLISDVGTFIVDGYLNNVRRLLGAQLSPFRWAIATIEDVSNTDKGIVLRGKAVPFVR